MAPATDIAAADKPSAPVQGTKPAPMAPAAIPGDPGSSSPQPVLRAKWTVSEDQRTYDFTLRDDINNAVKDAMKAKDERKLSTLRMVNSTIKNADIAARGEGKPPLSDADLLGVFQKMIKQRRDSIGQFEKGGRTDLAEKEQFEIDVLEAYMPAAMSDAVVVVTSTVPVAWRETRARCSGSSSSNQNRTNASPRPSRNGIETRIR